MDSELETNVAPRVPEKSALADIVRVLLMAGFLAGAAVALYEMPWGRDLTVKNITALRSWLTQWGAWTWAVFLIVGTALVAIGFPRILLAAVAGAVFGATYGSIWSQLAMCLAILPVYWYTRFVGRDLIVRKIGSRLERLDDLLRRHGFTVVLLIRLSPVGNNMITNYLAGVTAIPLSTFFIASFIGYLPQTYIFALMGSSGSADAGQFHSRLWTSVGLLVAFSVFFIWYFRRSKLGAQILNAMRKD
jgi:uncharacterized membrane protein YdjX (TVP38/TMEM64 family)